jgi:hypothetical protein
MQPTEYTTVSLKHYETLISLCMIGWSLLFAAIILAVWIERTTRP